MFSRRLCFTPVRFFSKSLRDKVGSLGGLSKKRAKEIQIMDNVEVSVETDAKRLVEYVCGTNLLAEGGEDLKIKPDSEYPSWLKKMGPPVAIEEMDPNTKAFWRKLKKIKAKEYRYVNSILQTGSVHK